MLPKRDTETTPAAGNSGFFRAPATGREHTSLPVAALEYHLFEPRSSEHPRLTLAYEMWQREWQKALADFGVKHLDADEFRQQDEISALFVDGYCIAVTALRWVDRSKASGREDPYFSPWPASVLAHFDDAVVGISSNTVTDGAWRGARVTLSDDAASETIRLSLLTLALAARRFVESPANVFFGIARNERAMNRQAAVLGGECVGQTLVHGTESDLILIPCVTASPKSSVTDWLWDRRQRA
jgi:hypothetical protein